MIYIDRDCHINRSGNPPIIHAIFASVPSSLPVVNARLKLTTNRELRRFEVGLTPLLEPYHIIVESQVDH